MTYKTLKNDNKKCKHWIIFAVNIYVSINPEVFLAFGRRDRPFNNWSMVLKMSLFMFFTRQGTIVTLEQEDPKFHEMILMKNHGRRDTAILYFS